MTGNGGLKRLLAAALSVGVIFTALPTDALAAEDVYAWPEENVGGYNRPNPMQ